MPTVSRAADLWRSLEPRAQITLAVCAVGVLFTAFTLYQLGQRPNWTTVASGMSAAEGADVAQALEGAGIRYELRDGGAIAVVEQGQETRARVQLAQKGLPNGGHVGYEIFDTKSFGATDFEQKVAYQRALEGEIARTIEGVDGVRSAEVQLVLPKSALFLDDGTQPTAAVLLEGGTGLERRAVAGIARLVSSSVEGLKPDEVTITDETGALLWPSAGATGGTDGAMTQLEAERAYASQVTAQLDALILSTLGPGKATARVSADLDLDKRQIDSVTYGQKPVPLQTQTDSEKLVGGQPSTGAGATGTDGATGTAGTGGVSGVAGNVPGLGATTGTAAGGTTTGGGSSNYTHDKDATSYGVDKRVESVTVAPGAVKRLSVALVVDKGVPEGDVKALQQSVASAAGIDPERGDIVTVARVAFADRPAAKPVAGSLLDGMGGPLGIARWAAIGIGSLVLLLLVRKGLKRREREPLSIEPTWLREVNEARPLAELEATMVDTPRVTDPAVHRRKQIDDQVEEIIRRQPETVAAQVNQWMKD